MDKRQTDFEQYAKDQLKRVADASVKGSQNIHIHVSKLSYEDHATVSYNIGDYGDTDKVTGNNLPDVITEYLRRKGWTERNKPMMLLEGTVETNDA